MKQPIRRKLLSCEVIMANEMSVTTFHTEQNRKKESPHWLIMKLNFESRISNFKY